MLSQTCLLHITAEQCIAAAAAVLALRPSAAAGELAVKLQPCELAPYATSIAERLVPILAAPAGSMPRSIIENRQAIRLAKGNLSYASCP